MMTSFVLTASAAYPVRDPGLPLDAVHRRNNGRTRAVAFALVAGCCVSFACSDSAQRAARPDAPEESPRELVVLVHGMGRTPLSMVRLERDLQKAGYRTMNWGYSSYCCTIDELGTRLREDVDRERGDA